MARTGGRCPQSGARAARCAGHRRRRDHDRRCGHPAGHARLARRAGFGRHPFCAGRACPGAGRAGHRRHRAGGDAVEARDALRSHRARSDRALRRHGGRGDRVGRRMADERAAVRLRRRIVRARGLCAVERTTDIRWLRPHKLAATSGPIGQAFHEFADGERQRRADRAGAARRPLPCRPDAGRRGGGRLWRDPAIAHADPASAAGLRRNSHADHRADLVARRAG